MRRISVILAIAAVLLTAAVGYTYKLRVDKARARHAAPVPHIKIGDEAIAQDWREEKTDDRTGRPIMRAVAKSFEGTHDPSTFELNGVRLRLFDKTAASYTYVKSDHAFFNEGSGMLTSDGPVHILINVPADKDAEDPNEAKKLVQVTTSGVKYETKTGKASTDQPASFVFPQGDGQAVGADYDPNAKLLHLKSQVSLDWVGNGPAERKIHVEAGDLVYKEAEGKVYLSPWSKMQRQTTTIQGLNSVITLLDGVLHQIDSDHAFGTDRRDDRQTSYSADTMTAMFDDDGNLIQIVGNRNARVESSQPSSRTLLTGDRADLHFAIAATERNGMPASDSQLHEVLAEGHAVAESTPLPQPSVQLPETRILRSERIELGMRPGGQDVQEIRAPSQAQLEFKPNRADQSHRILDASRLRIVYGDGSYVDTFYAWNVATHTDKPASPAKDKTKDGKPAPALTWSDQMVAKFTPNTNQIATIDQTGSFRYQEGTRKAWAKKAFLEQTINRITLTDGAHVLDDTGSAVADQIVMNQANGDMDATGHVLSTHAPDKNEKPGTSMLDATQPMQAQADRMQTREDNTNVFYQGHVVMWQGANRISANEIAVNRDEQSLHAVGNVASELLDNKSNGNPPESQTAAAPAPPIFTVVRAPELFYRDDTRIAHYTGGVKLLRDKMTVTSKEIRAFLTPKTKDNSGDSSLDHALADGNVQISQVVSPARTRTGNAEHCEYYTKDDKVVLNGGAPQMHDTVKGMTKGRQLTYFSDDDRLIVEGQKDQVAVSQMRKK
ncbi:MAG TPA: LPS export ABC transporter periplasmic protein LptC [Bryobacteraceae bacterium]|jgi:lipopolysaccharide export system protein LptA